jgi:hypothetical protein
MNVYLNDKIIDDQGNVKTISSGQDARLYYVDVNGERKKYLLDGEISAKELDPIFSAVSGMYALKTDIPANIVTFYYQTAFPEPWGLWFNSNQFIDFSVAPVTNLILSLPPELKNAAILFRTGDTITYTINIPAGTYYKINKPFEFEPNSYYLIAADNNVILWTKIEEYA